MNPGIQLRLADGGEPLSLLEIELFREAVDASFAVVETEFRHDAYRRQRHQGRHGCSAHKRNPDFGYALDSDLLLRFRERRRSDG